MVRRSLGTALWSLVGLVACTLGGLSALVGTDAGRALLAAAARGAFHRVVAGRVEVGGIGGSLLTGVVLNDVVIYDPDSTLVARLPHAELDYNPLDFVAGRIVLSGVTLDHPYIDLVQHKNGKLNLAELLRLGGPPSGRPPALVLLRNLRIEDGTVAVRLQDRPSPDDSAHEIEDAGRDGRRRVRRFEHLTARIAALRLSSPRERGIEADIGALAVLSSDPGLRVTDLQGRIRIAGDSLNADLQHVGMPGSRYSLAGRLRWPRDTVLYDLAAKADSATLTDLRFVSRRFPVGAVLKGNVEIRSHGGRLLEVHIDPLDLGYRGGRLTGRLTAVSAADSGLVALRQTDVEASDLDLGLAHAFLDSLPFYGRLTGHTRAEGAFSRLALEVDWSFRDSLVAGWPETRLRGHGDVDLLSGGLAFRGFGVEAATVDLRTVHRLAPAVTLNGVLDAAGTLTGPYRDAQFSGTLRHRDGEGPASSVRGTVRLDLRGETLGVFADVTADSLSFDGLRPSFPGLPLMGAVGGTIRLAGPLTALRAHVDVGTERGGRVQGDAELGLGASRLAAREIALRLADVDLSRWIRGGHAPPTRLSLAATGGVAADSGEPPGGAIEARLGPSFFGGAALDSGAARLRFADRRVHVDSLAVFQPGLLTTGAGSLGWRRPAGGSLTLDFDADSLNSLDSLVTWITGGGRDGGDSRAKGALGGTARVSLTLTGALDSLAIEGRGSLERFQLGAWRVPAARAHAMFEPGPVPVFVLDAAADSIALGRLGFGAAAAVARGSRDSLTWFARSRVGDLGAFLAGGRLARDTAGLAVGIDSLAVLLPGGVWFLERPTELHLGDSVISVGAGALKNGAGPGRLVLRGDLPARGSAAANLQLEEFPVAALYALFQKDTLGVGGTLTATLGLSGSRAEPTYTGSFVLHEGTFGEFHAPFLDGSLEYRGRRLDGELHLWRTGKQVLTVTAHLPLDLALQPVAQRQLPDTLAVRAAADSVDLSLLEAVTPLLTQVRGAFTADLGIGGTWDNPQLRGALTIDSAAATIPALGVRYEQVHGRLRLSGDTIAVDSLALAGGRGRAVVTGAVVLERLTHPRLALAISAQEFKALEIRGYLSLTASGDLTLTGPVVGATLRGQGTVTDGVLYFADLVNKRVVNLDQPDPWIASLIDTTITETIRRERLGPAFQSVFLDNLSIDGLQLAMGSDVWLRSTEANIQLTGTVSLKKTQRNYLVSGTLQAPRGTYRLIVGPLNREFVVSSGTVRYFGTPDLDAGLDIEAKHIVHATPEDVTVVAHIGGSLLQPKLTLSAEKRQLSQTEVISYLLFGAPNTERGAGQGGPTDRAAMVRNALGLISASVSGEIERTFISDLGVPLDYFEFRPVDPSQPFSGAQLAAGWQLGRKTFIVLNAGFCQQGGQVDVANRLGASLQFRISPEWRTEASFEPVSSCGTTVGGLGVQSQGSPLRQFGFDLFWEKRY